MRLLIVDDEPNIRRTLSALLTSEGYPVNQAPTGEAALADLDEVDPDIVLLDLALPGMDGLQVLERLRERRPGLPVVMMSGRATLSDAVRATRLGAFHFIEKPLTPESVLLTVRAAAELRRARDLSQALLREAGPGVDLVGRSAALKEVRARIERVAPTDARVLVTGESGTGKELVAAAIHGLSSRREGPFVRVNSAAIPRDLVESEMFGHERGAFTGASDRRPGKFELAHGGTLFLDEVGDLDPDAQAKLLRALESGEVQRLGGSTPTRVDVRVVAATNRDLHARVREGVFREDLLYRLEVVPIHVPPLRDRPEDIPPLLDHATERLRSREGIDAPSFTPAALKTLRSHPWPGNVRELLNVVERLAILHAGVRIDQSDVEAVLGRPRSAEPDLDASGSLHDRLEAFERTLIQDALGQAAGNVAAAARALDTDRANLYRRMRRLGISPERS